MKAELSPEQWQREANKLRAALQADDEARVRRLLTRWESHGVAMGRLTPQERQQRQARRQGARNERQAGRQQARQTRQAGRTTRTQQRQADRVRTAEQQAERRTARATADTMVERLKPGGGGGLANVGGTLRDTASSVSEAFADLSGRLFGGRSETQAPDLEPEPEQRKSLLLPLALGATAVGGLYFALKGGAV